MSEPDRRGITRRGLAKSAVVAAGGIALGTDQASAHGHGHWPPPHRPEEFDDDVAFVNGTILTLDEKGSRASSVAIRGGRIVEVGRSRNVRSCKRTIDLKGATVIPGLIDSHQHFMRACHNPGHEVRAIEAATSVLELQQAISGRSKSVPVGEFITCIGGWNRNGLAEKRLPTPGELDAAAPLHPVYLSETGGGGQAVTNTLGRAFFTAAGVAVDATTGTLPTGAARTALNAAQTADDKRRGTAEGIAYVASLGLTTIADQGGVPFADWKYAAELWNDGELDVRLRQFFSGIDSPTLDMIKTFILNQHRRLGDDRLRIVGVGERITSGTPSEATVLEAGLFCAERGWTMILHSLTPAENQAHINAYKTVAQQYDIAALRFQLHHINDIPPALLAEVAALGIPVGIQGWRYTSASGGAPFRSALDLGITVGGGTDATNVAAQNPWLVIYHMVSGKNNAGVVTNAGQQVTRTEALEIYTKGSAYLTGDDDDLGTIEEGKLADLAVLSDHYLKVPEEQIKKLRSDLTLQGGRVVHAAGRFSKLL